jgi:RNA polymerase sigma-70 factor (ECF subfamily)
MSEQLDRYRPYLELLARMRLDPRYQAKIDTSDIVQQTLLQAHQGWAGYRGTSEAELMGWLRQILARNIAHLNRDFGRDKRDIAREQPIAVQLDHSSMRLEAWIASQEPSPSQRAVRNEDFSRLSTALGQLNDAQRAAVELHYWHGWTLAEIGERLERSPSAVAGLLHRGLAALRAALQS